MCVQLPEKEMDFAHLQILFFASGVRCVASALLTSCSTRDEEDIVATPKKRVRKNYTF